jgi:hypothetical protein
VTAFGRCPQGLNGIDVSELNASFMCLIVDEKALMLDGLASSIEWIAAYAAIAQPTDILRSMEAWQ